MKNYVLKQEVIDFLKENNVERAKLADFIDRSMQIVETMLRDNKPNGRLMNINALMFIYENYTSFVNDEESILVEMSEIKEIIEVENIEP